MPRCSCAVCWKGFYFTELLAYLSQKSGGLFTGLLCVFCSHPLICQPLALGCRSSTGNLEWSGGKGCFWLQLPLSPRGGTVHLAAATAWHSAAILDSPVARGQHAAWRAPRPATHSVSSLNGGDSTTHLGESAEGVHLRQLTPVLLLMV